MWYPRYLIVSIPDICRLSYFKYFHIELNILNIIDKIILFNCNNLCDKIATLLLLSFCKLETGSGLKLVNY